MVTAAVFLSSQNFQWYGLKVYSCSPNNDSPFSSLVLKKQNKKPPKPDSLVYC